MVRDNQRNEDLAKLGTLLGENIEFRTLQKVYPHVTKTLHE